MRYPTMNAFPAETELNDADRATTSTLWLDALRALLMWAVPAVLTLAVVRHVALGGL